MTTCSLTFITEVIDHDDLVEEPTRTRVDDTVHGAHERRPALVMKDEDNARVRQSLRVLPVLTPVKGRGMRGV